jgi:hypothetical protein
VPRLRQSALPIREELDALAHAYHHLHNEVERTAPESSARRRLEAQLLEARRLVDRLLDEWVPDERLREEWRLYLKWRGVEPAAPAPIPQLLFRGVSYAAGSVVEVRGEPDDAEVYVDGTHAARVDGRRDFAATTPGHRFRLDEIEFEETFKASAEALDALRTFVEGDASPPWSAAQELLADGLVDRHFAITPRGRRALAS